MFLLLIFSVNMTGKLMRAIFSVERCISPGHSARNFFSLMEFSLDNRGGKIVCTRAILAPDMALTSVFPNATRTGDSSCCGNFHTPQRAPTASEITKLQVRTVLPVTTAASAYCNPRTSETLCEKP